MRSGPNPLAGADINGCDTAAHVGVDLAAAAYSHTVTRGGENVPTVGRRSPENAAGRAASADLLLPDRFAVVIGIESVNNGRLVPRKEDPLAVFGFDEDGRCAKVIVWRIFGTHDRIASATAAVPHIEIGHLANPADFPRLHVQGDNGIGGLDGRKRVGIPGADIDSILFRIDGRCEAKCDLRSEEHTSELQSPCNLV